MTELEEQYAKSEQKRRETEEKAQLVKVGGSLPNSPMAALKELQDVERTLADVLDGRAFQRFSKLLEILQSRVEVNEELKQFGIEIDTLRDTIQTFNQEIHGVFTMLKQIDDKLSPYLEKANKLMQKQMETTVKLNKYLDNWV